MRKVLILALCILSIMSCQKQKPSPRRPIMSNTSSEISVRSNADKVIVPFSRTQSGLAEVQVSLNGVPFNMWWDTGASITSISALELAKLAKEGKIDEDDYVQTITTRIADGTRVDAEVYLIKELYIKGENDKYLVVYNIHATVSDNLNAPLLIGQNVIQQLPKHSFNESKSVIEFDTY